MMSNTPRRTCGWRIALIALILTIPGRAAGPDYKGLVDRTAPALVTVKFVLKVSGGGGMMGMLGDQESESEVTGVVIDPTGVVMCSNSRLGGFASMLRRFAGPMGGTITATPTNMKVLIGDDTEGVDATLIARDSELDLAWIRINDKGTYQHLDLSKGTTVNVGDSVLAIRRMGRYFARTVVVSEGRIGGITSKPRRLYVPTGDLTAGMGLPVFTMNGTLIGVVITQTPDTDSDSGGNPMSMFGNVMSMQDTFAGLILPADKVARATQRALRSAEDEE